MNEDEAWTPCELDQRLRDELHGMTLVGEIPLGDWGPASGAVLAELIEGRSKVYPRALSKRVPAVFVTYLCWQGIHNYDEGTFWPNVSIAELRDGKDVGPAFMEALRILGLSTFDDLEELEGIGMTKRYVRRIHLHGGLPVASVPRLLDLLRASLRHGLRTTDDVIESWITTNVAEFGLDKPAERLLLYTGSFGASIIDGFIELLHAEGRRQADLTESELKPYLIDQYKQWRESRSEVTHTWRFVEGPKVEVDRFGARGPYVRVPAGDVAWYCGTSMLGYSDPVHSKELDLEPAAEWSIGIHDRRRLRFSSLSGISGAWLFDERGRIHRSGTFHGTVAYLVALRGATAEGEVERRQLAGVWDEYDLVTISLKGCDELVVHLGELFDAVRIQVDSTWGFDVTGDVVTGVTGVDGEPVLGESVLLREQPGYFPDPDTTRIRVVNERGAVVLKDKLGPLHSGPGEYDLGTFDGAPMARLEIEVAPKTSSPRTMSIWRIPGLRVDAPLVATPDAPVAVKVHATGAVKVPDGVVVPAAAASQRFSCALADCSWEAQLEVSVDRCSWSVTSPDTLVPEFSGESFILRPEEMRNATLQILTDRQQGLRVWLQNPDGDRLQRLKMSRPHLRDHLIEVDLGSALDTATASPDPRLDVVLGAPDGRSVVLGQLQTGPCIENLEYAVNPLDGRDAVEINVRWDEQRPWPNRAVRVWSYDRHDPVAEVALDEGICHARSEVEATAGMHLLEVGAAADGWTSPSRPRLGPGCATVHLGAGVQELLDAVRRADARFVVSTDTPDLPDMIADLVLNGLDGTPLSERQQRILLTAALGDTDRLLMVLDALAAPGVSENDEDHPLLSPSILIDLVQSCFDEALKEPTEDQELLLAGLWEDSLLLAAAVDGDISSARCRDSLGWCSTAHAEARSALDDLVEVLVGATEVNAREVAVKGSSYIPTRGSRDYWHRVVAEMPKERSAQAREWTYACHYSPTQFRGTPFAGLASRVRKQLDNSSGSLARAGALVLATTAVLWPSTPLSIRSPAMRVVIEALSGDRVSVEPVIALGIGAAHVLRGTPGWTRQYRGGTR